VGTLNFESGVVRVDGRLQGKIIGGGTLIIGEGGILQGEIHVSRLILCGRAEGTVGTSQFTHIAPTGKLFGKVQTPQLVIDEGGIFDGESKFMDREETETASPQP
jgi:cytoskeletal protein CcmA (bactofilin family)